MPSDHDAHALCAYALCLTAAALLLKIAVRGLRDGVR